MTIPGFRCPNCGKSFTRRPARCNCGGREIEESLLEGRGTVYTHTTLHAAAEAFEKDLPFQMAIVELDEGPRLTCRVEGEPVQINDRVEAVAERDGVWFFATTGHG